MSRRQKARLARDSCIIPIHGVLTSVLSSGFNAFALQPSSNFGTRLLAAADEWAHFRVLSFDFRIHRNGTLTAAQVAGYVGGVQDTTPTTIATVGELLSSCCISIATTVPSEWCRPSRSELAGCFPWYKSVPGSADPTEEAPGFITIAGTGAEQIMLEYRGRFEFKTSVATTNTPDAFRLRVKQRIERQHEVERRRMLALLTDASSARSLMPYPVQGSSVPPLGSSSLQGSLPGAVSPPQLTGHPSGAQSAALGLGM